MNTHVRLSADWRQRVHRSTQPSMHRLVDKAERIARGNVADHTRSGELLSTVRSTKSLTGGRVWIGTGHWRYIEYGTPPHIINPRVKQALWWEGAPYPVRRVYHPGITAYAPMMRTLKVLRW